MKTDKAIGLVLLGLIPIFFLTTWQIWSAFKSTDKNREAKIHGIGGLFISVGYSVVVSYLFGWLDQPTQTFTNFLRSGVDYLSLFIWTIVILFGRKIGNFISQKIIRKGSVVKSSPKKRRAHKKKKKQASFYFSDQFKTNLDEWIPVTGSPQISDIRGLPDPPSLLLEEYPTDRRNSFIIARTIKIKNGKISCDVYLEREAVFNLVFRANDGLSDFYMARIDSRPGGSNGLLRTSNSINWGYFKQPNTYVVNDRWYHVELIFKESKITFKIDSETMEEINRDLSEEGSIGMFNEVKRAFVNNLEVEEL